MLKASQLADTGDPTVSSQQVLFQSVNVCLRVHLTCVGIYTQLTSSIQRKTAQINLK